MKKEHQAQAREKRNEAYAKKAFTVCGYEIWKDPLNFIVKKEGMTTRYFPTILLALTDIKEKLRKDNVVQNGLEASIKSIIDSDDRLLKAISSHFPHK